MRECPLKCFVSKRIHTVAVESALFLSENCTTQIVRFPAHMEGRAYQGFPPDDRERVLKSPRG